MGPAGRARPRWRWETMGKRSSKIAAPALRHLPPKRARYAVVIPANSDGLQREALLQGKPRLDVVHRGARRLILPLHHVGDGRGRQDRASGGGRLGEDRLRAGAELAVE